MTTQTNNTLASSKQHVIPVTQQIVAIALRRNPEHCAIAKALRIHFGDPIQPNVGPDATLLSPPDQARLYLPHSPELTEWIKAFDTHQAMLPIHLLLDLEKQTISITQQPT